ncbi:MAG: hypothetical protein M3P49_07705 [Actinomycetota bacterium]|nr:hypothetical protein [Actinomycetota bacterium]
MNRAAIDEYLDRKALDAPAEDERLRGYLETWLWARTTCPDGIKVLIMRKTILRYLGLEEDLR